MDKCRILFDELDKCIFIHDFEYEGALEDYTYNGITYSQSSITYYSVLLEMYRDFLGEWMSLSENSKHIVRKMFDEIKCKRYINGSFFFDVPSNDAIQSMIRDNVSRKDIQMARFVCDMASQQSYFLEEVMSVLDASDNHAKEISLRETEIETVVTFLADYPDILTTSDVAKIFHKSTHTIREWERKGKLINVSEDALDDKDVNSNGHRKRRMSLQFRKSDIISNMNLRKMLIEEIS